MDYTFDNIGEWVADLATKTKATQFHTYARILRDKERQGAQQAILNKANSDYMRGAKDVVILNDDMAIIAFTPFDAQNNQTRYMPVVQDKPAVYWFTTFEGALLGAISILKTGDPEAAKYAAKVLEVEA